VNDQLGPQPDAITPKAAEAPTGVGEVTFSRHATFAPSWFEDAKREATCAGRDARRREILFAVCFAESYLLEWVRDSVLKRRGLEDYFSSGGRRRRGVIEKWREIPKLLKANNKIREHIDYQSTVWTDFTTLTNYRDGLVHARASLPHTHGTPKKAMPEPSLEVLNNMPAGEPTRVVVALVRALHVSVGMAPPAYIPDTVGPRGPKGSR
jgi:hypothetical protein